MGDEILATLFGTEFHHSLEGLFMGKFKFSSEREDYLIWLSPSVGDPTSINSFTLNLFHVPTSETFCGHFTTPYVNQLTQKTGSIKDFKTFLNMLKSALTQKSRSVRIEFLSTEEIHALKAGGGTSGHAHKCYILLSYSSEFDQVRYPIPLTFIGKLSSLALLEFVLKVQCLKGENILEARGAGREKDREEINILLQDKRRLEEEVEMLRRYQRREDVQIPSKEIKVLKRVIRSLEQDLMVEKSQHKKFSCKKNEEYNKIGSELDRLRASERTLKIRVRNLTEELATIRRHRVSMSPIVSGVNSGRKRSLSADRGKTSTPVNRGYAGKVGGAVRKRSSSLEKPITSERMSRRQEYLQAQNMGHRSRTPSPRFDPTAYIREQTRKRTESGGLKHRPPSLSNQRNGNPIRSRSHSRDSYQSNGGRWSHYSSATSLDSSTEDFAMGDGIYRKKRSSYSHEALHSLNSIHDSSTPVHNNNKRVLSYKGQPTKQPTVKSKPKTKPSLDHSINLSDIDQRLKALKFLIHDH